MYPMVPFYTLPALHEEIRDDSPPAYGGVFDAYREMIPAMLRQRRHPGYYVERVLPATANPSVAVGSGRNRRDRAGERIVAAA